jgi:hypothetical protein
MRQSLGEGKYALRYDLMAVEKGKIANKRIPRRRWETFGGVSLYVPVYWYRCICVRLERTKIARGH